MTEAARDDASTPEEKRMTIGEHLEELRSCLLRSLIALVLACLLCIWPARYLLEIIARPVIMVLRRHGQPANFLQTSPVEAILIYVKVVVISGLVIAAPYVIYQLWSFVAAGLYKHERSYVLRIAPPSIALFVVGVVFMYTLVLLVSLNFLVGFSNWLPLPDPQPLPWERPFVGGPAAGPPASQPGIADAPQLPVYEADPPDAPPGRMWINLRQQRLKVRGTDQTYSLQLILDGKHGLVTTHFKIGDYLSFFLIMTIAFGLAFQMPLVVMFLARSGIVPVEVLRKYRKVVILLIVFIAGILAPPDVFSHLLLSGPMILLFELGMLLARRKARTAASSGGTAQPT